MAKETNKPEAKHFTIRDAGPEDAAFLAKCVMAGMHYYDFEPIKPEMEGFYQSLVDCERRTDLLYTFANSRIAEVDGKAVGSLLSYPGDNYKELRHKTFSELWPEYIRMDTDSEQETGPGEYYLDTLAVVPEYRHRGIGRALLEDGIRLGKSKGFDLITLVVDSDMPDLVRLYESVGFRSHDHRRIFGVDFLRMSYRK